MKHFAKSISEITLLNTTVEPKNEQSRRLLEILGLKVIGFSIISD
jgi:RimJ/RimL family protein N-acetyltransferase